ncbi:MAG: decaprenyl-phosphate phosphoribosyltransferase [Phycisphaeraceae bacterium]|nr:MAG: decaprenyl-phosphate phosphoribosyltransferase [Phycisphaeraceae bacterium]
MSTGDAGVPGGDGAGGSVVRGLIKLARPHQWAKSAFVYIGPMYNLTQEPGKDRWAVLIAATLAAIAFSLASSGCYVFNDLADREADRLHPRKKRRPIASGVIAPGLARVYGVVLLVGAFVPLIWLDRSVGPWVAAAVGIHIANVLLYSVWVKHRPIADVISLSLGFVLRVIGGCAAVAIAPTTWLLNVTFFLSMFLAFGKRLGERRSMGSAEAAAGARKVQGRYSDEILRMVVVVTAVATLLGYAGYVQTRDGSYQLELGSGPLAGFGFNLLWLTMLPATYGLLRAMLLLENGKFDDPTELAAKDRAFQLAAVVFVGLTVALTLFLPAQG